MNHTKNQSQKTRKTPSQLNDQEFFDDIFFLNLQTQIDYGKVQHRSRPV